jgi:tetratricopeptide (TPR) repeat protein
MAHAIESRASSPANALRDALDKAERDIVSLNASTIESFLVSLDQIEQMFESLAQNQTDLRPEEVRWESLLNRLSSNPAPIAAAASRAGGMASLRGQHPPAESFWWRLDEEVTRRRVQSVRRVGVTLGASILVVALVLWGVNFFFPPDPKAVLLSNVGSQVDMLVLEQKWAEALEVVEQAQTTLPNEPELLAWEIVLAEQLGDAGRAQTTLTRVQTILADQPAALWILLGNHRLQVGNLVGAEQAAQFALALEPDNAQATFLLGGIKEAAGDTATAVDLFNKTFDLAESTNPQLAVIARVRMGNLLQRLDPFPQSTITTTQPLTNS